MPLFISYRNSGEKLMRYQPNSSCVIMFINLITTLFYKALILQGELWCWSLLGLKGLKLTCTCNWQGFGQFILKLSHQQRWVRSRPGKAKCESCLPKGLAGISVFLRALRLSPGFFTYHYGMHHKNQTNTMLIIFLVQIRYI